MTGNQKIELQDFLKHQHICQSMTLQEIDTLLDFLAYEEFDRDEVIAEIGQVGENLYLVVSGEVKLEHQDSQGNEVESGRLYDGELAGEMSFFDKQPRSVRMTSGPGTTKVLRLSREMYKRLRVEHPYIAVNLLEHALISLDHLFRRISSEYSQVTEYIVGAGTAKS
ncbi:Crp/Fnr family transcriptional regulator [Thiohalorhabdus sp.]|uniref:Crp/Fnr family transcriptional regulator n=1 Tax=Thiohalorhabdus sp. TaxID=3094134 RepID=UPI002FC300A4